MRFISVIGYYILGIIGLALFSCLPLLFQAAGGIHIYFQGLAALINVLTDPAQWVFAYPGRTVPIMDVIMEPFIYSMTILLGGLVIGLGGAFLFALISVALPGKLTQSFKRLFYFFEGLPDVMIAFLIQIILVIIYKNFHVLLFQFASVGGEEIYILPMLILAILPFVSFYRIVLGLLEDEQQKEYVGFARSKGIGQSRLLLLHTIRNIIRPAFLHTKLIVWAALSTLPAIEYLMNLYGVTNLLMQGFQTLANPLLVFIILTAFFTPFYFLYRIAEALIGDSRKAPSQHSVMKSVPIAERRDFNWFSGKSKTAGSGSWKYYIGNKKFMIGLTAILLLFTGSVVYTVFADPVVEKTQVLYDEQANPISNAPHQPSSEIWFGTDRTGRHIGDMLIAGAKYTIGFAAMIAGGRILLGFLFAVPYTFLLSQRWRSVLDKVADGLHFVPQSLLALAMLSPFLISINGEALPFSLSQRLTLQTVILIVLALPLIITLIAKEIRLLLNDEYITSAIVLGGTRLHLFQKHVWPHLSTRFFILFGQQFIQVLLLFIHLGVFGIFFGGTIPGGGLYPDAPATSEWSSQIPFLRIMMATPYGWYSGVVLIAFMLLIFCVQLTMEGLKEIELTKAGALVKVKKTKPKAYREAAASNAVFNQTSFTRVRQSE